MIMLLALHSAENIIEALYDPFDPDFMDTTTRVLFFIEQAVNYYRFCDGRAYHRWDIDRERVAVIVVRPDMHVG